MKKSVIKCVKSGNFGPIGWAVLFDHAIKCGGLDISQVLMRILMSHLAWSNKS